MIDSVEESDESFGFTGTHAPRTRLDLEMESRIPSKYRVIITEGDIPPLHKIKTGSGLVTSVRRVEEGLESQSIEIPDQLSGASKHERWKYMSESLHKPTLYATEMSLIDATDAAVFEFGLFWGSSVRIADSGNERQLKLRDIAIDFVFRSQDCTRKCRDEFIEKPLVTSSRLFEKDSF